MAKTTKKKAAAAQDEPTTLYSVAIPKNQSDNEADQTERFPREAICRVVIKQDRVIYFDCEGKPVEMCTNIEVYNTNSARDAITYAKPLGGESFSFNELEELVWYKGDAHDDWEAPKYNVVVGIKTITFDRLQEAADFAEEYPTATIRNSKTGDTLPGNTHLICLDDPSKQVNLDVKGKPKAKSKTKRSTGFKGALTVEDLM